MLIVIRDGKELSQKARLVVQLFELVSNSKILYVFRNDQDKFRERRDFNQIDLATSTSGIFVYFFFMLLKTPKDMHDGILRRLSKKEAPTMIMSDSFFSVLTQSIYQYLARSARTDGILQYLRKTNVPKVFVIDEFWSLNSVNPRMLKTFGAIIFVSQDLAYDIFGFGDNIVAKKLMYKLESEAIPLVDVVVACSERDRLKYLKMGAKKVVSYPNLYPIKDFEPCKKDDEPSVSIVLRGHWGSRAETACKQIFGALACIDKKVKVYMFGTKPEHVPKNVELHYFDWVPTKLDYLKTLSKSWIGINLGIHMGGTNERKYDYAMAGAVVISDSLGARGDMLPFEYSYVDGYDLAAKLDQMLNLGKEKLLEMGIENRKRALSLAESQREKVLQMIKGLTADNH